jgi:hypothetical protein
MSRERVVDLVLKEARESKTVNGVFFDEAVSECFFDGDSEVKTLEGCVESVESGSWIELATRLPRRDLVLEPGRKAIGEMNGAGIDKKNRLA